MEVVLILLRTKTKNCDCVMRVLILASYLQGQGCNYLDLL